ncbi:hypothetical protein V9T40_011760 [Parthenolecanium corni]|uniref:Uncharacterized protein n=1 Tax=Parthenolecanium corni TaxID=536013 RepID=A0AAN9T9H7_9HEMI
MPTANRNRNYYNRRPQTMPRSSLEVERSRNSKLLKPRNETRSIFLFLPETRAKWRNHRIKKSQQHSNLLTEKHTGSGTDTSHHIAQKVKNLLARDVMK